MGRKKRIGENTQQELDGVGNPDGDGAPPPPPVAAASVAPPPPKLSGAAQTLQTMLKANPQLAANIVANPLLATQLTHIAQAVSAPATGINPDVQELCDHFGLDERIGKQLDDEMKKRDETFPGDLVALWDILETARNPAGLLSVKIKEMQEGTFIGQPKMDKDIKDFQRKYRLDDQATRKLAEALQNRPGTRQQDMELIHKHLETSNKPSARVMMMLGKLRSNEPLGEPDKRVAPGSYLDRMEQERDKEKEKKADRDKERQQDRRSGGGGDSKRGRSRDRAGRGRSRSREKKRSRSRDRH